VPTSIVGLIVFVGFLVPGFVHYTQRRSRVPQRSPSALVETANLVTVSVATNAVVFVLFASWRSLVPKHSPDVRRLIVEGWQYSADRLPYLGFWVAGLLLGSSALAFVLGIRPVWLESFSARFAPTLVDASTWYHVFEAGPAESYVWVGCDLRDGAWVAGALDWYSTEIDETADRELAIAGPIEFRAADASEGRTIDGYQRLVISAREIVRLYVTYLDKLPPESGLGTAEETIST